jgi:predicted transcriptional regulator
MSIVKERMAEVICNQPEDATYNEILKELAFEKMINNGLEDSRAGKTISNENMKNRINSWQK